MNNFPISKPQKLALPGKQSADLVSGLKELKSLLQVPERWTEYASARTAEGSPCDATYPGAVCWCLTGAVLKVVTALAKKEHPTLKAHLFLDVLTQNLIYALRIQLQDGHSYRIQTMELTTFNDAHDHKDVLALIDATLATQSASETGQKQGSTK